MEKLIRIKSNNLRPRQGRVLVADPLSDEFYFGRSVVLLVDHNDDGAFGIVMNKPTGSFLSQFTQDFEGFDVPVFIGGPVKNDNLFYIHNLGPEIPHSTEIFPGLYWGGQLEVLIDMMKFGLVRKDQIRFFLGYSGWSPKQLEDELQRNAWVVSESNYRLLMKTKANKMWDNHLQRLGPKYDLWRGFPVNPELN